MDGYTFATMKLWDPHFHIWAASAGVDDAGYGLASYERDAANAMRAYGVAAGD